MSNLNQTPDATVPPQREAVGPVKKSTPVVIALIAIVALIGIANISSLVSGKKKAAPASALQMRPSTANAQQVSSFETMQQVQARKDADDRQRQQELAAEMQQLQQQQAVPGPEAYGTPKMSAAQRSAIYGDSPNAPKQTSNEPGNVCFGRTQGANYRSVSGDGCPCGPGVRKPRQDSCEGRTHGSL